MYLKKDFKINDNSLGTEPNAPIMMGITNDSDSSIYQFEILINILITLFNGFLMSSSTAMSIKYTSLNISEIRSIVGKRQFSN